MRRSRPDMTAANPALGNDRAATTSATHVHAGYLMIGVAAVVAGLMLGLVAVRPPAPKSLTVMPEQFSAENVLPLMLRLLGDAEPHPIGTEANVAMRGRLIAELEALELEVTTQETFACRAQWFTCGYVTNVMARLPGEEQGPAVMLTAHYDSVGASPGVSDDLAGVAVIIETARLLQVQGPMRNPVLLVFTDGEEVGLLGAEGFVSHPYFAEVGVVVNLEARGTDGQSMLFETSEDNAWLIEAFAAQAERPVANSLLYELYRMLPNDTDFSVYKEAGIAGVNFAYSDEVAHYHTPLDGIEHLGRASLQHHGENALAAARAFGAIDLSDPAGGDSIYLDLVPGQVVRLPAGAAVPLAVAGLLLWVAITVTLGRRSLVDIVGIAVGALAALLGLALAGFLGAAVVEVTAGLTGRDAFYHAEPLPTRTAIWLAALLGTLLPVAVLARRTGFWGLVTGVWLLWALIATAGAIALPGASVFFLVPLLMSGVVHAIAVFTPLWRSVWAGPVAAALAAFVTAYLWLPFVVGIESGLGLELAAAIAVCAGLAFSALAPLAAQPRGHGQARAVLLLASVAAIIGAAAIAADAENFSEFRPQRLSLLHLQEAEAGVTTQAWWLIDAYPGPALTEELSAVENFVRDQAIRLPWTGARFLSADAPQQAVEMPTVNVVSDADGVGGGRIITLELGSPRRAPRLLLAVPSVGLERIVMPETQHEIPVRSDGGAGSGPTQDEPLLFTCHGVDCDGTVLELHYDAATTSPLTLEVFDLTYGLPAEGAPLREARPENAVPSQDGDVTVMRNSVTIGAQ